MVVQNGYIPRGELTKIDAYLYFDNDFEGKYALWNENGFRRVENTVDPFELITYEDEEAKKEETTLVKTNNK